ncbi:regulatory protein [Isoptericola sp. CG 20/1183]|uniref:Regulatory protein RecX n=1 Tax=Isoptericola halotolerans TaxID=300560 RepID=A0ABX5EFG2_9MICO|nr:MULTISPECIES: regulatory protein RecX [Isoptericola]MCK0116652.1 RecX family transcriptional regulator [Isoptericola sp. S6320L]PRZ05618.1 regulatory protein [Isoptericola halotolerans]PRZ06186.1 regulatory protein [Isoptericola sp. CG 20/1183]
MAWGQQQGGRGEGKRRGRPNVAERLEAGELSVEAAGELARESVLRALTAAPKSRAELARSLARKGFPEHVVEPVLDRFEEVRLVDDAEYAEMIVRTRHSEKGQARRAISAELRRRGVDTETAAEALEQIDADDERIAAAELARKHVARTRGLDRDKRVRRAVGSLSRKGHNPSVAFAAVKDALAAEGDEGAVDELDDVVLDD